MENNEFNYSSENTFKKSTTKNSSGFGKTVFVPFLSGILGASLVVGTCFGVPTIKSKLIGRTTSYTSSTTSDTNYSTDLINLTDYSNTAVGVAEKVLPSVVGIKISYQINSFFGSGKAEATGSGIIISEDGYIVTNNHVVSSESSSSYYAITEATGLTVSLYGDDQTYEATIVGTDPYTDLAVIKIEKDGLTPAELGDSTQVKVGEFAMAIGNPVGMDYTVTSGIISAVDREVTADGTTYVAIQTDAAINSGNSGGALVNSKGQIIGINTLKLSGSGIEGIGFAIPISSTTNIVSQLIENKTVIRPYIGIEGTSVDSTTAERYNIPEGVYVEKVEDNSPAKDAGIEKGNIITKIEGTEVKTVAELNRIKYNYQIGDTVTLTIYKDGSESEVKVKLGNPPAEDENKDENKNQENSTENYYNYYNGNSGSGSIFDLFR